MKGLPVKVQCYRQDFTNFSIESQIGIPPVLLVISPTNWYQRTLLFFLQNMIVNSTSMPAISQLHLTGSTALGCGMCNTPTLVMGVITMF